MHTQTAVILHDIRSAHNVGSIFRTADGAGVSEIMLTGYTPSPIDRFGRKRDDFAKVSLGAEENLVWKVCESVTDAIASYKAQGFEVISVEQSKDAVRYTTYTPKDKRVFIFGNETEGLSEEILNQSDAVIEIPLHGQKESLNVSVAAGIVLFAFLEYSR